MKKIALGAILVIVAAIALAFMSGSVTFGVHAYACQTDDEIAQAHRSALDDTAMAFVRTVLGPNPDAAYAIMTQEAQTSTTAEAFGTRLKTIIRSSGPYRNAHVAHTYLITGASTGQGAHAICGSLANDGWVSVAIKPTLSQGYVVVSAQTKNNDWALTLWLLPVGNEWHVHYFHIGISSIVGRTPETLLSLARQERDSGHNFNATMLFAGLTGVIDRGPVFQLGIAQTTQKEARDLERPSELQGSPPFTWNLNGGEYTVAQISSIGVDNRLGLIFMLPQTSWTGEQDADTKNRAFITAFIATHPDYSRVFSFLVARALKPDSSGGFGTVYDSEKGFD